ncbi:MAG: hypothetical protein C4K60_21320 [Ideonella sp. MAG2]|nr:MAG: hypothetical protein C4K60_21320 [Ideonella sp. MAG2]
MNTESSTPGRFVIDRKHWPERDILAVPYFFFIKDGVIVSSHLGWLDGSKQKISQNLQEIGLLAMPTQ